MDLQLKPVLISGVMHKTGNSPPGMLPARAKYMTKDLYRLADYYRIEFKFPSDVFDVMLNKGSLKAQRLLTATKSNESDHVEELSRQLFRRVWLKNEDITEDGSLREACNASNMPADLSEKFLAMTSNENIKDQLKASTSEAIEHGAFGLPVFVIEHNGKQQMMFGSDRLFLLAHYLGENWPLAKL